MTNASMISSALIHTSRASYRIELSIPEIDANKKTKVYTPSQPAQFLGVELHLNGQDYVLDVPMKQIVKACDNLPSLEMAHPSK